MSCSRRSLMAHKLTSFFYVSLITLNNISSPSQVYFHLGITWYNWLVTWFSREVEYIIIKTSLITEYFLLFNNTLSNYFKKISCNSNLGTAAYAKCHSFWCCVILNMVVVPVLWCTFSRAVPYFSTTGSRHLNISISIYSDHWISTLGGLYL